MKGEDDPKIAFYKTIKNLELDLKQNNPNIILNSFIVSRTALSEVYWWAKGMTKKDFEDRHVFFQMDRFKIKWPEFLSSDPHNQEIYQLKNNRLTYLTEQLIPSKTDHRTPLLFVFGNPASHSVNSGMFFSFEGNGKEHRFWKNILKPSGILNLSFNKITTI